MVDTTDYAFEYIAAADIKEEVTVPIVEAGGMEESEFGSFLFIGIELNSQGRKVALNKSNTRRLSDAWGRKTEAWVGHKIKMSAIDIVAYGKKTKSIYVEPAD